MSKSKVTIKRSHWTTGRLVRQADSDQAEPSYCALGFCMKAMGFSDERIHQVPSLLQAEDTAPKFVEAGLEWLLCPHPSGSGFEPSAAVNQIVELNDWANRAKREALLKKIFEEHGTELEFED